MGGVRLERIYPTPHASKTPTIRRRSIDRRISTGFLRVGFLAIPRELARLIKQIAMLLEAGIPLLDALLIIKKQSWNRALADAIDLLVESIEQGETISSGLQKSPGIFDPLAVSLVSSGEVSGTLPEALVRLAQHLERNIKIQREALSAMIYPLSVLTVAALVSSFLLIFIIPVFRELFLDLGAELPWPTRVTVALSEFVIKNVPTLCGALVVFSFFLLTTLRSTRGKRIIMAIFLLLPLSKDNMTLRALARTTRTLGTALQSGIPIITALKISSKTAGNSSIERTLERAIREISEGRSLTHALRTSSSIPSMMIEMLEVGERTGQLDTILLTLADNFEIDAERALNTMKQVMEPLILAALGLVIGGFVISMYLPVFSLGTMAR